MNWCWRIASRLRPVSCFCSCRIAYSAAACPRRLTHNVELCERCGRCPVGALLDLRDVLGIRLAIATGGTIARRIVVEIQPRCIVAVACERDLTSGIQDSYPVPVFGVLNERPCGHA